jgi:hypothetical protein
MNRHFMKRDSGLSLHTRGCLVVGFKADGPRLVVRREDG